MTIDIIRPQPGYEPTRQWLRYKVDVPVRLIAQGPTKVAAAEGRGKDLCVGGMAVLAGIEVPINEQVEVEFTPPYTRQPLKVRGFVRNSSGNRHGIEFITENDADYYNVGQLDTILTPVGGSASE